MLGPEDTIIDISKTSTEQTGTPIEPNVVRQTNEWTEETAVQEFPTNAFGEINFINEDEGSIKPAK